MLNCLRLYDWFCATFLTDRFPLVSFLIPCRVDSVFITHWGVDNLLGLNAVLPVAFAPLADSSRPDPVLCLLCPPPSPTTSPTVPDGDTGHSSLALSVSHEMSKLIGQIKRSGIPMMVRSLARGAKMNAPSSSVQLYHKVSS